MGTDILLHCIVFSDQCLDFDDIRAFTVSRPEAEKFNVSINCYNGGRIRLPWPFFSKNVVSLHVRDCTTEGFLSERSQQQIYPNELKEVLLSNIKHKVNMKDFYDSVINIHSVSKDFECGHTGATVLIFRNIEHLFPPATGGVDELIMIEKLYSAFTVGEFLSHNAICMYPKLRYLEESGSSSFSALHLKIMESSQYPRLRVYSLRNNSLHTVPVELENMTFSFLPNLSVLDLSENDISSINFVFSGQNTNKVLINLRRNVLRQISAKQLKEIVDSNDVILDIRENPLDCTCELYLYGEYLLTMKTSAIATAIYKETKCQKQENGILNNHFLFEKDFGTALCSTSQV